MQRELGSYRHHVSNGVDLRRDHGINLEMMFQLIPVPNIIPYISLQLTGISVGAFLLLNNSIYCLLPI